MALSINPMRSSERTTMPLIETYCPERDSRFSPVYFELLTQARTCQDDAEYRNRSFIVDDDRFVVSLLLHIRSMSANSVHKQCAKGFPEYQRRVGSRRSRSQSPTTETDMVVMTMTAAGISMIQGADWI